VVIAMTALLDALGHMPASFKVRLSAAPTSRLARHRVSGLVQLLVYAAQRAAYRRLVPHNKVWLDLHKSLILLQKPAVDCGFIQY
jgi:hypothetical protein